MVEKTTITMNCGKIIFYIVLIIFIIHVEISLGEGMGINSDLLKKLIIAASKNDDCSRRITIQHPIPLRYRRVPGKDKFPCVIKIDIWNELIRNGSVHIMFHQQKKPQLMSLFHSLNMKPTILINDVQKILDEEEQTLLAHARSRVAPGIHDTFHNYDQLTTWLKEIVNSHSTLATLLSIGKTYENRDIWLVKLTSNNGQAKKKIFMDFGIHAREWISPATGAYIINELLTKYATGGDAKTILDTWELHIVPVLNPDGYAHSHSTARMWRKNRRPTSGTCIGVDLNRNFGYMWNKGGSSSNPCDDTYHGGSAMSENEAKALQNYMTNKPWDTYLTFHSYGQGYTTADPPNFNLLKSKAKVSADAIRSVNGRVYTIGSSAQLLYVASGGSEDWTAGTLKILYSYCYELPPTGGTGFLAPTSEIKKTGHETYIGLVAFLKTF
ncbi:unnamed protein product [Rotaria sp. Silwood1]|nr:unnamed protein product [Rotaria sp. Silwood1]CAF4631739.1 unnamed protein product [Rotaria sp. Silwood1]